MPESEPKYLIFDGRAMGDFENALVLDTADTLEEARRAVRLQGDGCIWSVLEQDFVG